MSAQTGLEIERHTFELRVLTDIAKTLTAPLPLSDLLHAVMDKLNACLAPADIGAIMLWDDASDVLRPQAVFGYEPGGAAELGLQAGEAITGRVFADGQARLLATPAAIAAAMADLDPAKHQAISRAVGTGELPRSALAAPLGVGERKFGVLLLETLHSPAEFTEDDLPFVQTLADLIALAIDRGKLEDDAEAIREARRVERLRSEVMATLSHELRTPLAAIKGYSTALMLEEVSWPEEKRLEFLRLIDEECDNLQAMIAELLDSALIDIGQLVIDLQPMRLPHLLSEVATEMQHRTTLHHLLVDAPPDFPIIDADPHRIKQVVRNILDNAIKYSPNGGLVVIRGVFGPADVTVSISDQGVGIAPKDMIPLFDKYFRAKSPTGYHVPGTGLGLPVARAIVEAHGGRIWAESKVGQGTTLFFSLPRAGLSSQDDE